MFNSNMGFNRFGIGAVVGFLALLLGVSEVRSQCAPLTTIYATDNTADGVMFDIQALVDVTITGFQCNLPDLANPYDIEIYVKTGTHIGSENIPGDWVLAGTSAGVVGGGPNVPTLIPIVLTIPVNTGQVAAFYITETGGPPDIGVTGTTAGAAGALYADDGNIQVFEGSGVTYPFGVFQAPRVQNITVLYDCCEVPQANFTNVSCPGATDGTVEVTGQGTGPWTFTVSDVNGVVGMAADTGVTGNYVFSGLIEGPHIIAATDANGCTSYTNGDVGANPGMTLDILITDNLCFGGMLGQAQVEVTGGIGPYDIEWADAFAVIIESDLGSVGGLEDIDSLASTAYNVFVTDANGCTEVQTFNISQPPNPLTLTTTPTDALCADSLNGSIQVESDGAAPYTYTLHDVSGVLIDSVPNTATVPYTFASVGAGDFFVTVIDANGCVLNGIESLSEPPTLNVESSMIPMLCYNEAAGVANIDLVSGGVGPYAPPVWDDPASQTGNTATNLLPGTYTATITDANGCSVEEVITFLNPPQMNLNPSYLTDTCNAGVGTARTYPSNGTPPYTFFWKLDGSDEPTLDSLSAGSYEVVITDANNCKDSTFVEVKDSINSPTAQFDYRFIQDEDFLSQRVLFESLSQDGDQYFWEFGDGGTSNFENPEYLYSEAGDYLVRLKVTRAINPDRCSDVAWQYVNIDPLLTVYIPNAFTPGRNGFNDVFGPRGEGIELESWDMFIYNRWGQLVWQTGNYDKFWDGTNWFTGEDVPMGTYVYHIKFREFADLDRHEYTGWVNVLRD